MKDNSNSDLIPKIILSSTVMLYRKGNLNAIIQFGFTNVNDREPYKYFKQRSQGLWGKFEKHHFERSMEGGLEI